MKKQIYLIDLTHESKLGLGSDTIPLQLGLIGAYCLNEHGDKVEVKIFKFLEELEKSVKEERPFIIAASNYLWNIDFSYKVISLIKQKYPKIITVFGGPNYPDDFKEQLKWLRRYPSIDFYISKDGEVPFAQLVGVLLEGHNLKETKRMKSPSCHALLDGKPYFGQVAPRLKDLSVIPSPYTTGLMSKFFEQKLLPTIQTNRGCPFTCTYCTEGGKYYSLVCKTTFKRKKEEIDYIIKHVKHTKTLRITDSNFGMFEEDVEFCKYLGEVRKKTGYPDYLACSTGKNQKERILKCNELVGGLMRFTASVQSLNEEVLKNIKRINISIDEIMALSDKISDTDTHSYSEIILGLPGDSLEAEKESMEGLIKTGISNITQHQLALIYGSEVNTESSRKKFRIKSMFRPIQRCVGAYSFLGKKFHAIEIEEICVSNSTLSLKDYLGARKLYLTVGLFYNDRIFGEIHALLRLLHLSTWKWLELIHENINYASERLKNLYDGFIHETKAELWDKKEDLIKEISANIKKYISGEAGGNLIYKYRAQAIIHHFDDIQTMAFQSLKNYLASQGIENKQLVNELEHFSKCRKSDLLNLDFESIETFDYDFVKMIKDVLLARNPGSSIKDIHYRTKMRIAHNAEQKETMKRQLNFYGSNIGGLTMLISRFPIKRFWRIAEVVK